MSSPYQDRAEYIVAYIQAQLSETDTSRVADLSGVQRFLLIHLLSNLEVSSINWLGIFAKVDPTDGEFIGL